MNAWMESNLNPWLAAVWLDALLKSFVVLAFVGGLCLAWRRAAAATRHLIWFLGVAGLLLLPLLPFVLPTTPRPLWTVSGEHVSGNEIALSLELGLAKSVSAIAEAAPTEHPSVQGAPVSGRQLFKAHVSRNWVSFGFGAWAFGALLVLLYPVLGRFQLLRMERNAEVLATSEWIALLAETSEMLGLRRRVVLLRSRASVMPLTWGWLRPKVLMPVEAEQWPLERRQIVLLHELAHVKRRDCLTQSITRFVCALYWFNPLAWIAAQQMRVERERACDDLVLNGGCKASDYAGHLVEIATTFRRAPQAGGIAMARSSNLEQRVTAIVDVSRARRLRPAGLAGILISIAAVILYIGGYKTSAADNDRSSSASKETLAQIEKFSAQKEAQAKLLAAAAGEKIMPEFQKYFAAARSGDVQTVTNMYADFKKHHPQYSHSGYGDLRLAYRTSYWQPMLEICLVYDQFATSDSKFTQEAVRDIFNSIPSGSIYFGGTDPGRGLPTAFSKSHVDADPFYTISQNPLADPSYEDYLRKMYGHKRQALAQFGADRQGDPELSKVDKQLQAAKQKALLLEMSKPDNDPARVAADKAVEDLSSNVDAALARVEKAVDANENSTAAKVWPSDKVIYIPTVDDVQKAFMDYSDAAKKRLEEKKLKPGEEVKVDENGHVRVSGQVAVQAVNARISKLIFDKNPDREFYVEESFPHDWMYPHLEPNGLIMKINREPLAELPDAVIQKDLDYWQSRVDGWLGKWLTPETPVETVADFATKVYGRKNLDGFTGDPAFVSDAYAPKMYSKWRDSIANVYSSRLGFGMVKMPPEYAPKDDAEKQKLMQAADFAFKQAFAICPSSPEVVFCYVDFLVKSDRKADAQALAHAATIIDPKNENLRFLESNLSNPSVKFK
jgi:beta-lactamase regulating signal transducer with metallopeptidase domain